MYKIGSFAHQLAAGVTQGGLRDLDEAYTIAREHGITEIDFSSRKLVAKEMLPIMKRCGMHTASVHGLAACGFEIREEYQKSLDLMKRAIDTAVELESPFFMNVPQMPMNMSPDKHGDFVKAVREQFADLCEYAKNLPITVTVEDFSLREIPYATFEDIDYLLENIPSLKFTYDSGNFPLAGINEVEGAKRYAECTVYVHLKDLKVMDTEFGILRDGVYYDSLELGGGYLKNLEALKIIKDAGFVEGTVTIEVCEGPRGKDLWSRTLTSAEWLKTALAKI